MSLSQPHPGTQAMSRGLAVVEAVAAGAETLAAIGEAIGCTRSTTQRLTAALVRAGYLRVAGGLHRLGPALIRLGAAARTQMPLASLARPELERLAAETGDTVHLGIEAGDQVLYLDKIGARRGLEMRSRIGSLLPLALTGVGRALLLDAAPARWQALHAGAVPAHGRRSGWTEYEASMQAARGRGTVFDLEDNETGIRCVAAPVRDADGAIVAAISVAGAVQFMPEVRMRALSGRVLEAAGAIAAQLGHGGAGAC
jgi:DNA-binding IclR family transcriptional regulator